MKQSYLILITFLISFFTQAQIVNIPDVNFKNALVNTLCVDTNDDGTFDADADTNDDGDIQESEAESVISLNVSNNSISDLTGIEAFINLEVLNASFNSLTTINLTSLIVLESAELSLNQLTTLDFTSNPNLVYLSAGSNQLNSLNISSNSILTSIYIGNNDMTQLDISNNSQLIELCIFSNQINNVILPASLNNLDLFEFGDNPIDFPDISIFSNVYDFWCDSTLITSLDLSTFTNLEVLICLDNELTFLDMRNGNNANVSLFDSSLNSTLECIFVDDASAAYLVDWVKDDESTYVNDEMECEALSIEESELQNTIQVYPNPVIDNLNVKSFHALESIKFYDVNGKRLGNFILNGSTNDSKLDLSRFSKGVYFMNIKTSVGQQTIKIIKQ